MKKLLLPVIMLAALSAHAGGEKGNGGETVDVNGIPRLRDLVENTTCNWLDGDNIVNENPLVTKILKRISNVDWYFAEELRQEILDLDYCMTSNLIRVDTHDAETLVTTYMIDTRQAAIRLNRSVYVDFNNLMLMPDYDRAFLIIHEAMHTYLPSTTPMRNQRLRSMIKAVESVYVGNIATTKAFHTQMLNNAIQFPLTSDLLKVNRPAVMYAIGSYMDKRTIALESKSLTNLFKQVANVKPELLAGWHVPQLEMATLNSLIQSAIQQEDIQLIQRIMNESEDVKMATLAAIYNSDFARGSEIIRTFMEQNGTVGNFANSVLKDLGNKDIIINADKRLVMKSLDIIAVKHTGVLPMTALEAHSTHSFALADERAVLLVNILSQAIAENDQATLESLFSANPAFYRAFEVNSIKPAVMRSAAYNEMEKETAVRKLDTLTLGFWLMVRDVVVSQSSEDDWKAFTAKIDSKKLGYEIK